MTWAALSFALGAYVGWAAAFIAIRQREAARRDLAAELRRPVDLCRTEISHGREVWS